MLTLRFHPTGRKHRKTYRVVAAQKHRHVTKKFIEILGWYNPHTKECNLNVDRINHFVSLNTDMSDSVRSLLQRQNILSSK